MRKLIILAACAALAACSGKSNGSSSGSTGSTTSTSGSGSSSTGTSSSSTTTTSGSTGSTTTGSSGSTGTTGGGCGAETASCSPTRPCCTGLVCGNALTCEVPSKEGQHCDASVGCGNGLSCVSGVCHSSCNTTSVCAAFGDACGAGSTCCADLTCQNGFCTTANLPTCHGDGEACGTAADCCGDADAGLQFACIPAGDGGSVCHVAASGDPCSATVPCGPGLDCVYPAPPTTTTTGSGSTGASSSSGSGSTGTSSGSGSTGTSSGSGSGSTGTSASSSSSGGSSGTTSQVWGTCQIHGGRAGGPGTCQNHNCYLGDSCDPNGSSWCSTIYLVCDPNTSTCQKPALLDTCAGSCAQTAGSTFPLVCEDVVPNVYNKACLPGCSTDTDCTSAITLDSSSNNNPPPVTTFCDSSAGAPVCRPIFCYDRSGNVASNDPAALYQPCAGHPNSICVPQFSGDVSSEVGYCQAVRPNATDTVGQACVAGAGPAYPDLLCGSDAVCLGNVCQKMCDVIAGASTGLTCDATQTCISSQGVNVGSAQQVGGCGTPCDPWTSDEAASGCQTFCGGPAAVCNWIIDDKPTGYCGASDAMPIPLGGDCSQGGNCAQGTFCLNTNSGPKCIQLCDGADGGAAQDLCPTGQTCQTFQGFTHAGYCQ